MNRAVSYLQTGALLACLLLTGCGGEPYTYETDRELKPGPGIFSGEDGEFTLIGSPKQDTEEQDNEEQETSQKD